MGLLDMFKKKPDKAELAEQQRAKDFMLPPDVTAASQQHTRDVMESEMAAQKAARDTSDTSA